MSSSSRRTLRGRRLAPQPPHELARAAGDIGDQAPHLREAGAQLGVADLDGAHRVLQLGDARVRAADGRHGGVDEALHALGGVPRGCRGEGAVGQAVAAGEFAVGPSRAPVGHLDRTEELVLQAIGVVLVERLEGLAQSGQRLGEVVGGVAHLVEQLHPRLAAVVRHLAYGVRCARAVAPVAGLTCGYWVTSPPNGNLPCCLQAGAATAPPLVVPKKNFCTLAARSAGMSNSGSIGRPGCGWVTMVGTGPEAQWRVS